jgi:hypothetical protein
MMRPGVQRELAALITQYGERLTIRVSLDHPDAGLHDLERGAGAFDEAAAGLDWLAGLGARLAIAGRLWGDDEASLRLRFGALFEVRAASATPAITAQGPYLARRFSAVLLGMTLSSFILLVVLRNCEAQIIRKSDDPPPAGVIPAVVLCCRPRARAPARTRAAGARAAGPCPAGTRAAGAAVRTRPGHCRSGKSTGGNGRYFVTGTACMAIDLTPFRPR